MRSRSSRATGEIAESIRIILSTSQGERPMRPTSAVASTTTSSRRRTPTTAGVIIYEVRRALARWEPRITVLDIDVNLDRANDAVLYIVITYSKRGTNDPRNLVFPFYVIPEEG